MWHYRCYGVEAFLALGKKADAVQYAETSRGLNQPDSVIDQACEEILISSGLHEDAYLLDTEPAFALGSATAVLRWLSEGWVSSGERSPGKVQGLRPNR